LDTDHFGGAGAAPFGRIDVSDLGGGTVNVLVNLNNGLLFVATGFPGTFGFNLGGNPTIAVSNVSTGWSLVSGAADALKFDGFGDFEYAMRCDDCDTGASSPVPPPLSFDVTATGLTPNSFAETSTGGTPSAYMAVDVVGAKGKTGAVGAVGPPVVPPVPEPSSIALLGTTAGAFLFMLWSRKRRMTS